MERKNFFNFDSLGHAKEQSVTKNVNEDSNKFLWQAVQLGCNILQMLNSSSSKQQEKMEFHFLLMILEDARNAHFKQSCLSST
ncbi:hypothetical protein PR048_006461 [Dryococelus australis]|uniref:Uncharacterized protein n=1 Tax=Dryococelus australis TaxID=614101 RepID=A0ABQ9ICC7_9NEOP|nr:hypothetical protein PR048_006461 [Dryococelus australis]